MQEDISTLSCYSVTMLFMTSIFIMVLILVTITVIPVLVISYSYTMELTNTNYEVLPRVLFYDDPIDVTISPHKLIIKYNTSSENSKYTSIEYKDILLKQGDIYIEDYTPINRKLQELYKYKFIVKTTDNKIELRKYYIQNDALRRL